LPLFTGRLGNLAFFGTGNNREISGNAEKLAPTSRGLENDRFPSGGAEKIWIAFWLDSSSNQSVTGCMTLLQETPATHKSMTSAISEQIAAFPSLSRAELLALWKENYGQDPPTNLSRVLLVQILAYRIQEKAFGGLSEGARKRLREIAALDSRDIPARRYWASELPTGTKLIRSWNGEVHEVIATDCGYEYRGKTYSHLSPIAKEITGTTQSTQYFFGLRKNA